jgi:REP element-mobilizing transposase RayT
MPDHVHVLVEAVSPESNLEAFVKHFKQGSGFGYKRATGEQLWQEGFYDHVLREDEGLEAVARYLLENPVRARLVAHPLEWPYLASERYDVRDLLASVHWARR